MSLIKKLSIFILLLFCVSQLSIPYIIPSSAVYNERVAYDVIKDNIFGLETTIKTIKHIINKEKLDNYIIIIGDSVGYGTPCPPEKTISSYMNAIAKKEGSNIRIFNLSVPSNMLGDIYTIIKLLHKYDVSTQNLIVEFCYWEFVVKNPTFWFRHYLKELDRDSYDRMLSNKNIAKESLWTEIKSELKHLGTKISLLEYRGFIANKLEDKSNKLLGETPPYLKPWYKKPELSKTMIKPSKRWYYTDQPFVMNENNLEVYFLNKIIELQKDKNTIFFLTAMNDKLLAKGMSKPGYQKNLKQIDDFFGKQGLNFINYNKKIDNKLFSDFVHLMPEGYKFVAEDLWKRINKKEGV